MKTFHFSNSNGDNKDDIYLCISELLYLFSWTVSAVVEPELARTKPGESHNTVGDRVGNCKHWNWMEDFQETRQEVVVPSYWSLLFPSFAYCWTFSFFSSFLVEWDWWGRCSSSSSLGEGEVRSEARWVWGEWEATQFRNQPNCNQEPFQILEGNSYVNISHKIMLRANLNIYIVQTPRPQDIISISGSSSAWHCYYNLSSGSSNSQQAVSRLLRSAGTLARQKYHRCRKFWELHCKISSSDINGEINTRGEGWLRHINSVDNCVLISQ